MTTFVIVGAGEGGGTVAGSLRDAGYDGEVVLIGEEPMPPYERPPLSKEYLRGESDHHLVRPPGWYGENNVDARFGVRAERVDVSAREVELGDGSRIGYGSLIWATGGSPRQLGCEGNDLKGVHSVRTRADQEARQTSASRAKGCRARS